MQPKNRAYGIDPGVRKRAINQQRRLDVLGRVPMFDGLSRRALIRIDQLAVVRHVGAGDVVIEEGDIGEDMMIVIDGRASVRRGKRTLAELSAGQCVGEMALLDAQPRSATVVAEEPMRLLAISGPAFRKLLPRVPRLTETLLATLSTRLREANAAGDI